MGRGQLNMELISNLKARCTTFQKRKKGLKKKTYELSTLCGVDVCAIVYGPKLDQDRPSEPEIWPTNLNMVRNLINLYQDQDIEDRRKRTVDLSDILDDRKKKVDDAIIKLRKKNDEAKYPTWDNRFNDLPEEQLREIGAILGQKLEAAKIRFELMKGNHENVAASSMMNSTYMESKQQNSSYFMQGSIRRKGMQVEPIASINPGDVANYYPFDRANPMVNPTMAAMMVMNGADHATQLGGGASSSNNTMYPQLNWPLVYYDPSAGMLENVIVSDPTPLPYYKGPTMQPPPQYVHQSMITRAPFSQVDQFYNVTDFHDMKNQKFN